MIPKLIQLRITQKLRMMQNQERLVSLMKNLLQKQRMLIKLRQSRQMERPLRNLLLKIMNPRNRVTSSVIL